MHELAISRAILDVALRHAEGRRVSGIQLRVGRLRQVVPDSLEFYLGIVCRETPAEGAELELKVVDALMRCHSCSHEWDPAPPPARDDSELLSLPRFRCPACAEAGGQVLAGDQLEVDSITVEGEPAGAGLASRGPAAAASG